MLSHLNRKCDRSRYGTGLNQFQFHFPMVDMTAGTSVRATERATRPSYQDTYPDHESHGLQEDNRGQGER